MSENKIKENMNKQIQLKLETLKEFQDKYPTSHVGGSIGLMIRGIDLQRNLNNSDLDITIDENVLESEILKDYEQRSDANDFDLCIKKYNTSVYYTKIDIRINPEPSFEKIEFNGVVYNVSKLRDIMFWKRKYAAKGVEKHQLDIITIETGVRPQIEYNSTVDTDSGDLPF